MSAFFKEKIVSSVLDTFSGQENGEPTLTFSHFIGGLGGEERASIKNNSINTYQLIDKFFDDISSVNYLDPSFSDIFLDSCSDLGDSKLGGSLINMGFVESFKDSVVTIKGLEGAKANELIFFEGGASGLALNIEFNKVRALVFGGPNSVQTSEAVYRSDSVMSVGVGEGLIGRVVDPLGRALDGRGPIFFPTTMPTEKKAPGVITRFKISEPVQTGLNVVDALVPIGRGQRELILGDRKTGKTTVAVDAMLNQIKALDTANEDIICVYVAVGKRVAEVVRLRNLFEKKNLASGTFFDPRRVIFIIAGSADPAAMQYIAPYAACTMAEYFTYSGGHALIVYDDLTKHADAYRQISLLLRRPVGREAFPGDVFYLHARLLERAVKLNFQLGFGSLTALPIVETIQSDVSAYIPTNIISITDGQIYLDLARHQEGIRPAVDPGLSVSRVGSSAQRRLIKILAGSLKLDLAQFREVEQFSKFGSELDKSTAMIIKRGRLYTQALIQIGNNPQALATQVSFFIALGSSFFTEVVSANTKIDSMHYLKYMGVFLRSANNLNPIHTYMPDSPLNKASFIVNYFMLLFFIYNNSFNEGSSIESNISDLITTDINARAGYSMALVASNYRHVSVSLV